MSIDDIFEDAAEESDFIKVARELLTSDNIEMKTIIDRPSSIAALCAYREFLHRNSIDVSLIDIFLSQFLKLSVSKKGISREQIVKVLKSPEAPEGASQTDIVHRGRKP